MTGGHSPKEESTADELPHLSREESTTEEPERRCSSAPTTEKDHNPITSRKLRIIYLTIIIDHAESMNRIDPVV